MSTMSRLFWVVALAGGGAGPLPLAAQTDDAAQAITARDIAHHVSVIANDSMSGRDTPSKGLELTAQYVAERFKRSGLRPDGKHPTWFQRYPVPLEADHARSLIVFSAGDKQATAGFAATAYWALRTIPQQRLQTGIFLVAGRHTLRSLQGLDAGDNIVVYVPPAGMEADEDPKLMSRLRNTSGSRGLVVVSDEAPAAFDAKVRSQFQLPVHRAGAPSKVMAYVQAKGVQGLSEVFAAGGLDLSRLRTDTVPVTRVLPSMQIALEPRLRKTNSDTATAPNVLGILEGSDPRLKREYVVISAHMDHVGVTPGQTRGVGNGADDNASGIAGLIELAEAFGRPGMRPRRSLIFLAASGGAKELWGSRFFVSGWEKDLVLHQRSRSPVVAAINLDMIGGAHGDSVAVDGLNELDLAVPLGWTAAAHPDLRLAITDGGTAFSPQSDHFAFTSSRLIVPSLSFHTGRHGDRNRGTETSMAIDAERAARITRLVFYVSQVIANADQPPRWNSAGRRQMAESR
jgi:hypothetical protein